MADNKKDEALKNKTSKEKSGRNTISKKKSLKNKSSKDKTEKTGVKRTHIHKSNVEEKVKQINKKNKRKKSNIFKRAYEYIPFRVMETRIAANAGNTSFMILLSFFPFLIFTIIILKNNAISEKMLTEFIQSLFPVAFQETIYGTIKKIVHSIYRSPSPSFMSVTTITLLWLCSKATLAMMSGLNDVYGNPDINYIPLRIKSIICIFFLAIVIVFSLVLLVFGDRLVDFLQMRFPHVVPVTNLILNMRSSVGGVGMFFLFTAIYRFVPNHYHMEATSLFKLKKKEKPHIRITFMGQMPGALFSVLFWWIFSSLFAMYINYHNVYASFYGAMATVAIIMVWLYFCMYAFFLGGLVNSEIFKFSLLRNKRPADYTKEKVKHYMFRGRKKSNESGAQEVAEQAGKSGTQEVKEQANKSGTQEASEQAGKSGAQEVKEQANKTDAQEVAN
ncbi:MAG: YihY/virulence factor BrkB family protein [Lachnospiraceae bacterium]|nr:YihY/virulence factor BrkB family protein [Lachnospiraceae bacterium]